MFALLDAEQAARKAVLETAQAYCLTIKMQVPA